ncbi:putative transcription factor MYB-HB-like family [Helianthus annuus]|nr:putative transcription factor MYB-HB-like family [Helianthus annuus]
MYSGIHSIMPLEDFPRPNLVGDPCLVLTTDPKPRLRWTAELHERFVDAVTQLGGPDSQFCYPFVCFVSIRFLICKLGFVGWWVLFCFVLYGV